MRFNGFPIQKAKALLHSIQKKNDVEFENYFTQRKREIVTYHLKNNPFYKAFAGNIEIHDWNSIPVMTKLDLQVPLKERLSDGHTVKNSHIHKTSGSSGTPFYFAKDKFCHALTWSIFEEWYNWYDLYNKKQARFYGIPKDLIPHKKERLKDFFANRYRFNVFDLSEKAFEGWIKKFSREEFFYITGYSTVIIAFANYLISKKIVLNKICPTLKACLPTSEMYFENDKQLMNQAFGVPIINEYGAAEFGLIALENPQQQWELNKLNLFVEVLDEQNNPLPYGRDGKLVITDLYNKAHPFIRYEIGDIGKINKLEDGQLILEKLIGRKEDYVKLPSGKTAPGLSFYYVTKSVMQDDGNVKEIKVVQSALDTFEIQYVANIDLNNEQKARICNALLDYLEPNLTVLFTRHLELNRNNRGKLKQFTSLI